MHDTVGPKPQAGTGEQVENAAEVAAAFKRTQREIYGEYEGFLAKQMRRELARVKCSAPALHRVVLEDSFA